MTSYEVMREWMKEHPCIETWIGRLRENTRMSFLSHAYRYFNWVKEHGGEYAGKTPEELLDLQERTMGREQFRQVALLQRWLDQQKGRYGTKKTMRTAIRSFYNHNHVPLPLDVTYRLKGDRPAVDGTLNVEDFKKILLSSSVMYQAVFLSMFQGAMGEHEFEYFNQNGWEQTEPQLRNEKRRLKIFIPGRKHKWMETQNYYTFLGKDAVGTLKRYLTEERGKIERGQPIFVGERGEPLTAKAIRAYFHRHGVQVGVIKQSSPPCPACGGETVRKRIRRKPMSKQMIFYVCVNCGNKSLPKDHKLDRGVRYGISPHELRDLFRSEWELSPAKTVCAEFFMGHKIDPNMYNKIMKLHPDWAEEQYALAEPYLNVLSEDPRKIPVNRVKHLEDQIQEERKEIDRLKTELALTLSSRGTLEGRIEALEKMIKPLLKKLEELSA